jgi:hypothetical protein
MPAMVRPTPIRRSLAAFAIAVAALGAAAPASAWGARGHELVAHAAVEAFSKNLPSFLHTRDAREAIIILSRELDRSKNAGRIHDIERDPGHYINIDENGLIAGFLPFTQLPQLKSDFGLQLTVKGAGPTMYGYLPYAIEDGWQQLAKDFAQWRASKVGAARGKTAADRAWFAIDLKVREQIIIRDIGVWGHYVGDASQPLHVSEHHDGWPERYKDPMTYPPPGYPKEVRTVHNWVEGPFVRANISITDVKAQMPAPRECACSIETRTPQYITATLAQVRPLYELLAAGGFRDATPAAKTFLAQRIAAGAGEMRDMIEDAWKMSGTLQVGYPLIPLGDIESGKVVLTRDLIGSD